MKQRQGPVIGVEAAIKARVQRFTYGGLLVAAIGAMVLGKADAVLIDAARRQFAEAVAPVLEVLSRPSATVSRAVATVGELMDLREENQRLRELNSRLMKWETEALRLHNENAQLRIQTRFAPEPTVRFTSARVIGDTGGPFSHSLLIAAGEEHGVTKGQAVLSGENLIGRVYRVGTSTAWVLAITDLNSHIPVFVGANRIRAILAGNNDSHPRLLHLPSNATLTPGDHIITSGHGDAFPPGLRVGVVASISDQGIKVRPYAAHYQVEYVRAADFGRRDLPGDGKTDTKPTLSVRKSAPPVNN